MLASFCSDPITVIEDALCFLTCFEIESTEANGTGEAVAGWSEPVTRGVDDW